MKHSNRLLNIFILFVLLIVSLGATAQPAVAAGPFVCLPTCSTTDARMLSLASIGFETLAGGTISFSISVPGTMSSFDLGFFDGNTGGLWDIGPTPLIYTLYADPTNTGDESIQLAQWLGNSMADSAWTDIAVNQDIQAQAPSGDYFYHLHVVLPDAGTIQTWSNFKLRSNAPVELTTNESFAYTAFLRPNEAGIVYPNYPSLTPTTYDGTWDLHVYVPTSSPSFIIWDGDNDYGIFDCSINDTNDVDTPDDYLQPWVIGISDALEGVASSTNLCRNSSGQVVVGPGGQTHTTSNPPDDVLNAVLRRSPSVTYDVVDPNGNVYHNANPSGNREWEQFRIDSVTGNPADYYVNDLLPAGVYNIHVTGLDMTNLNAWHLFYAMLCEYADGTPCVPVLHPYLVGDTVWYDTNGNGVQDNGEAGILGVTITLLDSNGVPLPGATAVTDINGQYSFSVNAGNYTVQIDSSNFVAGGALAGYTSTTAGGEVQMNTVTVDNVLTYDFGYRGTASIGDQVWKDLNGNGIRDDGELGIADVTVFLLGGDGVTVIGTTTTDASGNYSFANLPAGTYTVQFVSLAGMSFAIANAGVDDSKDSDADITTGSTGVITLVAGQAEITVDAGLQPTPTVNYCGYIRTPGFWKNYKNHMSDATFLNLISHTQNFSTLTVKQAVAILSKNNGVTKMGIPSLDGVDARFLKFLLTAEINAVWNGEDTAATLGGQLGIGIYQGTDLTVNQLLNQAYLDRRVFSPAQETYVVYLGATGEGVGASSCLVQPNP
jgi:protocatechuate 3,4-dioxygenase beta subunit